MKRSKHKLKTAKKDLINSPLLITLATRKRGTSVGTFTQDDIKKEIQKLNTKITKLNQNKKELKKSIKELSKIEIKKKTNANSFKPLPEAQRLPTPTKPTILPRDSKVMLSFKELIRLPTSKSKTYKTTKDKKNTHVIVTVGGN